MNADLAFEFKFIEVIRLLGRPVTFYPSIARALGDNVNGALFLSNFWYWEGKQADQDEGWIYKSQREIKDETGLSRYQQESARRILKEYGIMEEKKRGVPARLYYRFNWNKLNEALNHHFKGTKMSKEKSESSLVQRMKHVFDDKYKELSTGIPFAWGDRQAERGKEWRGLKRITETFSDLIAFKRCLDNGIQSPTPQDKNQVDVLDQDIINSFQHFLDKLPEWHQKNSMSPELLHSRFNKIIIEITNDGKTKLNGTGAKEYVRSRQEYGG